MNSLLGTALLLICGISLSGCDQGPSEPLRVGMLTWPAYEMPFLSRELGLIDPNEIQLVVYRSPAEALLAYEIGSLDAVAVTIDYALQLSSRDGSHRLVMAIDQSLGGDALLAKPSIRTLEELRGKRIGVENSALGAYMLARFLDFAGFERDEVTLQSVDVPDSPSAFESSVVDAVITYEPYRTLIRKSGATELFSSRDIPGEIIDVLMTRQAVIDSHEKALRTLIDAWFVGAKRLAEDPAKYAPILAAREEVTPAEFLDALNEIGLFNQAENRRLLTGDQPEILPLLSRHAEIMLGEGLIASKPDIERLVDGRFHSP